MRPKGKSAALWPAALLIMLGAGQASVYGQHFGHSPCGLEHCPPAYRHYQQGGPKLHFKRACPLPVCDPCHLPHWGYYQPCWRQWPFPPNYEHCPVPPAASVLFSADEYVSDPHGMVPPHPLGISDAPNNLERLPPPGGTDREPPKNF